MNASTRRWMTRAVWSILGFGYAVARTSHADSEVLGWGGNYAGQTNVPSGWTNVVAIAAYGDHTLALTAEGRVMACGEIWNGSSIVDATVPAGLSNVVAIATGAGPSMALTADGRVVEWGYHAAGEKRPPRSLSNVVAIAAGDRHRLALQSNGQVVAWGGNGGGPANVPRGMSNVVAIAAGGEISVALAADGRVIEWGGDQGRAIIPSGLTNIAAIAAGDGNRLALSADGEVKTWDGSTPPAGLTNVVAIAAGGMHSLALTGEGRIVAWGYGDYGQTRVPARLTNVVGIAAGWLHSVALSGLAAGVAAPVPTGPRFLLGTVDQPLHHRIRVLNGADAYHAQGLPPGLTLEPHIGVITGRPARAGTYSVGLSATSSVGSVSWWMTVIVHEPALPVLAGPELVPVGLRCALTHPVVAFNAPELFTASGLPRGLEIDPRSGVITGAPEDLGEYEVSLTVSNRYGTGKGSVSIRVSPVVSLVDYGVGGPTVPGGLTGIVAIAAGSAHSLALSSSGTVVAWGGDGDCCGETQVPTALSNVVAIAAAEQSSLALTREGRVVGWGATSLPDGLSNVVAIAAGGTGGLALTSEGRVAAWGWSAEGRTVVLPGLSNVVAIATGRSHSLALTLHGQVVEWEGLNPSEMTRHAWLSNVVAIAVGDRPWSSLLSPEVFFLAVTSEGELIGWGHGTDGSPWETPVRLLSNVVAAAASGARALALTADGSVVQVGPRRDLEPAGVGNAVAIAVGGYHGLALLQQPTVPAPRLLLGRAGNDVQMGGEGVRGVSALLLRSGSVGGPWLPTKPVTFTNDVQPVSSPNASEPAQFWRLLRR